MEKCKHQAFGGSINVNRLVDTGRFIADIRIRCTQCNEPFRFLGLPYGIDLNGAAVSPDGEEGRFAIGTRDSVANIYDRPGPNSFTVKKT